MAGRTSKTLSTMRFGLASISLPFCGDSSISSLIQVLTKSGMKGMSTGFVSLSQGSSPKMMISSSSSADVSVSGEAALCSPSGPASSLPVSAVVDSPPGDSSSAPSTLAPSPGSTPSRAARIFSRSSADRSLSSIAVRACSMRSSLASISIELPAIRAATMKKAMLEKMYKRMGGV